MIRKLIILPMIAVAICAAILVVLIATHVVAIGGIYAYSRMKAKSLVHEFSAPQPAKETPAPTPAAAREANSTPEKETAAFYTVVKGDNPVAIAKKLHVSCDELLKLNKIEDPKKLQIGQKLAVPAKEKS